MRARARLSLRGLPAALLVALLACLVPWAPAAAGDDPSPDPVPAPAPGHPWFGPGLDTTTDDPLDYADRLGTTPSLYTVPVDYPLDPDAEHLLRTQVEAIATQGAVAVVDPQPMKPLSRLTAAEARHFAAVLDDLHRELDTYFLVRFAPEMNGSWVTWGQQPDDFVAAFRTVAEAVHAATDQAAMVWAPAYGSGYPEGGSFGAVRPSGDRHAEELDTNHDGKVDEGDDPYGPYYPGDAAVDWVGLTLYRFGAPGSAGENTRPAGREYAGRLDETWGYGLRAHRTPFYERFAAERDQPMIVETSALDNPADRGADELAVKRSWWRQVFAADRDHPLIAAISWLEAERAEPEAGDRPVDWRATHTGRLADALRTDLMAGGLDLGPVTRPLDQTTNNESTVQGRMPGPADLGDSMGWVVACVVLLALVLLACGLVGRWLPSWRYPEDDRNRDLRIDLFRGFLICTVVITHTELAGAFSYLTLNAFGAISGAEGFVMLSGVVLGMVHTSQSRHLGEWQAAVLRWRRARKIYLVALVVAVLVYVLGKVPGVDATVVTTFTDRGTGALGSAARGQVYDLYVNARHLFDYPPPWYAVRELLTLHMGPWVLNILGLFVVMTALTPALMWLLMRGCWWVVVAASWGAYALGVLTGAHLLPSQFEDVFPLLVWQVVFVHGLVIGHHRQDLVRALSSRAGRIACAGVALAYAGVLGWLWLAHRGMVPDGLFAPGTYDTLYDRFYVRVDLQPGRLLDLALVAVVAFAFLTTCWRPVNAGVGRFLVPLGQASLYVFIVHVFFVIAIDNIPGLDRASDWQGMALHAAELGIAWLMVRHRVLFSVIPR